jgi:hypothetical protein
VYNDQVSATPGSGASQGNITFESGGQPYIYDAWTGDILPQLVSQQNNGTVTIPVKLAGNQTTVIGFKKKNSPNSVRFDSLPDDAWISSSADGSDVAVKLPCTSATKQTTLTNGTAIKFPSSNSSLSSFALANWTLAVESWAPTSNLYLLATNKTNSTWQVTSLVSWLEVSSSLTNVSGRGYYNTSFPWSGSADGALLRLPPIQHTVRVFLNGARLPPLDPTDPVVDIGRLLKAGMNALDIVISTPLGNALRPIWAKLATSGNPPPSRLEIPGARPVLARYGLGGDVTVVPYWAVKVV